MFRQGLTARPSERPTGFAHTHTHSSAVRWLPHQGARETSGRSALQRSAYYVVGDRAGKGVMYRTQLFQIGNNTIDLI